VSLMCSRIRALLTSFPSQDCQLLLQKHRLYRCTVVVPNLLWLELTIVRLQALSPFPFVLTPVVSAFEYTFILWWNSFWTIAPAIAIGLFDRIVGMWSCPIAVASEPISISRRRCFDDTA